MTDQTINNSKVLVTGGAGFIGSNLCEVLVAQNNEVICLDNFSTGKKENIEALLSEPNFKLIEGDIRNYEDCKNAVDGCDIVLHQAALGSVPRSIQDPMTTTDVNIGGFVKMLHAASEAKVKRFVYAASSSTYGDHPDLPKQEHIIGKSLSPYAITKYVDELFAENFSAIYGIETIGLRYFNVFGKKQDPFGAYAAVIPKFVSQLIRHEEPVINGDGSYSRDFTYIDNVILANQLAAITPSEKLRERQDAYYETINKTRPKANAVCEIFNVACGEQTSLLQLFNYLKENLSVYDAAIAQLQPHFAVNRKGDVPHSLADISKGKLLFGYHPLYPVKEGLKDATSWYWQNLK
ncbi:SDR family NAD(P)-dependent oxidoreductase [Desertivirga xinjiangensis]|uniref:SDR family NAD(P)-dependent oxidoreductase n=1 Tax=Desertivirga xinjiangensis TaxID=539206 RepID=UPI00210C66C7|nr:SDR family NAD(P)-dependent oxidoreductase [Pedobacter xinjiangensis]